MGHNIYFLELLKSENKIGRETEIGKGESKNEGKCRRETMVKEKWSFFTKSQHYWHIAIIYFFIRTIAF